MHKISCTVAEKVAAWLEFSVAVFVQGVHTYNDNMWSSSTFLHVTQASSKRPSFPRKLTPDLTTKRANTCNTFDFHVIAKHTQKP